MKPTILFIPGAWHLPDGFDAVRHLLAQRGFDTLAVALPSIGAEPPTKDLADDTQSVRTVLERLVHAGKRVVVVAHSYAGLVGAAVKDLAYAQRSRKGESGGVIMLVYMAAFVAPMGRSIRDMLGGEFASWIQVDGDYCTSSDQANIFYNDLPAAEQEKWIARLQHISRPAFLQGVAHEPWHDCPCMYIFCERDQAIPIAAQEAMAGLLGEYTSVRYDASHSPFLSMPQELVEGLELAVKVGMEKAALENVVDTA